MQKFEKPNNESDATRLIIARVLAFRARTRSLSNYRSTGYRNTVLQRAIRLAQRRRRTGRVPRLCEYGRALHFRQSGPPSGSVYPTQIPGNIPHCAAAAEAAEDEAAVKPKKKTAKEATAEKAAEKAPGRHLLPRRDRDARYKSRLTYCDLRVSHAYSMRIARV